MYKIVYVLTTNGNDPYIKELMLSLYSLKKNSPSSNAVVVMDEKSYEIVRQNTSKILEDVELIKVDVPYDDNRLKSRFLKTTLRKYINGDLLFVDTDTIILKDINNLVIEGQIGAERSYNMDFESIPEEAYMWRTNGYSNHEIFTYKQNTDWFNSGVMFVKDSEDTKNFYEKWNQTWKETAKLGYAYDEASLNFINRHENLIEKIPAVWNFQTNFKSNTSDLTSLKNLFDIKIFHYAYFPPNEILNLIENEQKFYLVDKFLNNIHKYILQKQIEIIENDNLFNITKSHTYNYLTIAWNNKKLFNRLEKISQKLTNNYRKKHKKPYESKTLNEQK